MPRWGETLQIFFRLTRCCDISQTTKGLTSVIGGGWGGDVLKIILYYIVNSVTYSQNSARTSRTITNLMCGR